MAHVDGREFKGILGAEELDRDCNIKTVIYDLNTSKFSTKQFVIGHEKAAATN